jgi:hypothetical protein
MKAKSLVVLILGMLLALSPSLMAQTASTGALKGTVTDSSGAVIPGATVTLTSQATGQVRTASTGGDGGYLFPLIPPGVYKLKFSAGGFKGAEASGVNVDVTETPVFDQKMEVGAAAEQITVDANVETIETATAAMGTVVTAAQSTEIPLVTRNYTNLLGMAAGANGSVNNASGLGRGGTEIAVNGNSTGQNNYMMDGVSIGNASTTASVEGTSFPTFSIPNPDTLAEFKIQTSQYDAGYGRNPGANVNVITKSGTNVLHGTAFEFFRNTDLNANDFFRNRSGGSKLVLNQNQFGGVIGGPIKKDKLFIFSSYQQTWQKNGLATGGYQSGITLPPIPLGSRSNTAQFQAAMGAAFCPANHPGSAFLANPGGGGAGQGMQVACDGSNINPIAIKYLQATTNAPGAGGFFIPSSGTSNYVSGITFSDPAYDKEYQGMLNLDYILSSKNTFSFRFYRSVEDQIMPFPEKPAQQLPGTPGTNPYGYNNGVFKLTTIVTNNMVNELRASYQRSTVTTDNNPPPSSYASVIYGTAPGTGLLSAGIPFSPDINVSGAFQLGGWSHEDGVGILQAQIGDQLSWTHGKQTIRAGAELEHTKWNWDNLGLSHGAMNFQTFNDFLIGLPGNCGAAVLGLCNGSAYSNILNTNQYSVESGPTGLVHSYLAQNVSTFVQDDIKVSPRLTVNVGVRWEYDGRTSDKYGNNSDLWISQILTVNNAATFPSTPATSTYAGWVVASNFDTKTWGAVPAGVLQSVYQNNSKNSVPLGDFAPRLGFAWQPIGGNKLVVRGGAGFFYDRPGSNIGGAQQSPPYSETLDQSTGTNQFSSEAHPYNLIPLGSFPSRWLNVANNTGSDLSVSAVSENMLTPLVYSWNFNVQYQLAKTWMLETAYVGSRGIRLVGLQILNPAILASPTDPINGVTVNTTSNTRLRVPYLGFAPTGIADSTNSQLTKFNSAQISLRKQMSHGLTFQAAYTYSRSFATTASFGNPVALSYGLNTQYRPQRLVINYNYQLPSGNLKGPLGVLARGWSISGVTTIQGGQALNISDSRGAAIYGLSGQQAGVGSNSTSTAQIAPGYTYANLVTSGSVVSRLGGVSGGTGYINSAALTTIPVIGGNGTAGSGGTGWGNMGLGVMLGPGQFDFDTSLVKSTRVGGIHEDAVLQFRTEFFNLFNHPQFSNPGTNFGSSGTFGQITSTSVNPRVMQFALKYLF